MATATLRIRLDSHEFVEAVHEMRVLLGNGAGVPQALLDAAAALSAQDGPEQCALSETKSDRDGLVLTLRPSPALLCILAELRAIRAAE